MVMDQVSSIASPPVIGDGFSLCSGISITLFIFILPYSIATV
jgi:hypothetical protein